MKAFTITGMSTRWAVLSMNSERQISASLRNAARRILAEAF